MIPHEDKDDDYDDGDDDHDGDDHDDCKCGATSGLGRTCLNMFKLLDVPPKMVYFQLKLPFWGSTSMGNISVAVGWVSDLLIPRMRRL